jgi:hypothetical protein
MSDTRDEQLLQQRFAPLRIAAGEPDWADVGRRSHSFVTPSATPLGRSRLRRPLVLALALGLVATVIVAPVRGVPQRLAKLFTSGEPAPPRTERQFSTLDRGAPAGLETRVLPGTARKALETQLPDGARATLWVAPTARGGVCEMIEFVDARGRQRGGSGPGCDDRRGTTTYGLAISKLDGEGIADGPAVVDGRATIESAAAALIEFEDGTVVELPLRWISEPIGAGFFVYGIPLTHRKLGHLPLKIRFVDADGDPVGETHTLRLAEFIREHSPRP